MTPTDRATFVPLPPYRQKTPSLYQLEQALRLAEWGRLSPRYHHVVGMAAMAALLAAALTGLLAWAGLAVPSFFLPGVTAVAVLLAYCRWTGPSSWTELLDQELARYAPRDIESFKAFQAYCRAQGGIDLDEMRSWLAREGQAVFRQEAETGQRERPSQFLSRSL